MNFGEPGRPVHLVVGYQPYYTEAWSAVVMKGKELWKKHLPAGSTVEFQVGLQGAIIVNAMTGEKQHIGYVGDMPAIAATFRNLPDRGGTDIRIVWRPRHLQAAVQHLPGAQRCAAVPEWRAGGAVDGRQDRCLAARFLHRPVRPGRLQAARPSQPERYLNQNIEVITTNFRAGKLDAAVIWEPTASKIASQGIARRVASGEDFDALDGGFMIMLNDLLKQRPDVVRGWLEAELEAQRFLADPANADEVARMAQEQTEAMPRKALWNALYGDGGDTADRHHQAPVRLHRQRPRARPSRRSDRVPEHAAAEARGGAEGPRWRRSRHDRPRGPGNAS